MDAASRITGFMESASCIQHISTYSRSGIIMLKVGRQRLFLKNFVNMIFAGILTVATLGVRAHAEDNYGDFESYFQVDRLEIAPDRCIITATVDYDNVQSHMSAIRDEWLSTEKTTEFYQRHTLEIIFGIIDYKAGGLLLQTVYDKARDKNPDKCHFALNLTKTDEFGQVKSYPQLSWDFTATLASRIVWDHFDDKNLPKIALNYKFTSEADRLLKESQGVAVSNTREPDHPRSCVDIIALDVAQAFDNSPYAETHHLRVLDATNPKPLPQRANRGFACISTLVTNGGRLNVLVEPKQLNGKWYVSVETVP